MNQQTPPVPDRFSPQLPVARDNELLRHVYRMHLSTPAVMQRLFFPDSSPSAVAQVTRRLVQRGYLNRHRYYRTHVYFTLGPRSAAQFGAPRRRTLPLGEQTLPVQYATLALCCLYGDGQYQRLVPHELKAAYPWFPPEYLGSHPWCLHTGETRRVWLASVRVELAGSPSHVVRKHAREVYRYQENQSFRELLEQDGFLLVVITASAQRASAICAEAREIPWHPETRTLVIPDLRLFL